VTVQTEIYDMKVKPKVLIVDDEEHNIELYSLFLEDEFAIETAVTGEEAMQKIPVFEPDVILLDIMLPDISGYEICKKLRENDQLRLVKVLFVSGLVELDDRLHGYAVGADDYVTKPVNADELLAKVKVYSRLRKIEEIDEYKNTFMSLISHETSTPLNAIIGFSGLMLDHEDSQVASFSREIKDAGVRLSEKISKILFLNNIYNDSDQFAAEIVDVGNTMRDAVAKNSSEIARKAISINTEIADDGGLLVISNKSLLFKVFDYVIENALNHTNNHGEIRIKDEEAQEKVVISIVDEGEGFSEDQLKNIFEVFNCNDLLHHQKGLSISIAIAGACMQKFGGELQVKNEPGKGGRLDFTFLKPDSP